MISNRCPTCGQTRKRSSDQNSRYWKLLHEMARVHPGFTAEIYHEFLKDKFLPKVEVEMPDWTTRLIQTSTADLPMHLDPKEPNKPNWDDFYQQVEVFCAEQGVYLEEA